MTVSKIYVRGILLDIEGTTSSISFVHDVLFPFVRKHLITFLSTNLARADVQQACEQMALDAGHASLEQWCIAKSVSRVDGQLEAQSLVVSEVERLMDGDVKATGLKALQGLIWESGFRDGSLRSHVYPEVIPKIRKWRDEGFDVRIYSSGSIAAQKLFFGHVNQWGDCLPLFTGHYDTTIGSKKEANSYRRIAADWGISAADILFVSDIAGELEAAADAGFQVAASVRPGNATLPQALPHLRIQSFDELHLAQR